MKTMKRWLGAMLLGCVGLVGAAHAALTNYVGCVNDPLPITPTPFKGYQLVSAEYAGFADVFVWRYPCLNDPSKASILIRITPYPIGESCPRNF